VQDQIVVGMPRRQRHKLDGAAAEVQPAAVVDQMCGRSDDDVVPVPGRLLPGASAPGGQPWPLSVGSWIEPPRLSHVALGQLVQNAPSIRQRPSPPVWLGHHQCVTSPPCSQRKPQTGSVAVGAGQTVIGIDAIITDTKRVQTVALGR
jgi:hypothetical protein